MDYEADAEEETRPRERGRPKRNSNDVPEQNNDAKRKGRRRGRPSEVVDAVEPEAQTDEQPRAKRKRGRPSLQKPDGGEEEEEPSEETTRGRTSNATRNSEPEEVQAQPEDTERRKRGRKPKRQAEPEVSEEQEATEESQPVPKRKRGRPSLNVEEQPEELQAQEKPKRRGRPSLQDLAPEDAQNQTSKGSKSKKEKRKSAIQEDAPVTQDDTSKKRKRASAGRPSLNRTEPESSNRGNEEEGTQTSRRRSTNNNDDDEPPPSPEKPYLHLVPKTRRIRPSTINAKWSPLTGPSLPAISSILELSRVPIIQRTANTQNRRIHAETALRLITHRITKKLSKGLPFPPASAVISSRTTRDNDGGRETELDFEAVLDARGLLERQLVPGLQAVELLRRERDRMESELERDYERLRELEARARGQVREKRELLKKAHVLAPASKAPPPDDDDTSQPQSTASPENIFKVSPLFSRPISQTNKSRTPTKPSPP